MTASTNVWSSSDLSSLRNRVARHLRAGKERLVAVFFRLADKRVPREWLFISVGALALAFFLIVLFFDPYRR